MEKEVKETNLQETDFLFTKNVCCSVCGQTFQTRVVKSGNLRRLEPDFDLRPKFRNIDALKYEVYSCPHCGYSAIGRYFENLTKGQIQLIREQVCEKFRPTEQGPQDTYTYETAIARFKLALYNSEVKRAKLSEKAYTCLKISWLYRSLADQMPQDSAEQKEKKAEIRKQEEAFYKKAFESFQTVIATEDFPICGMDSFTMDYLLAALACHFKEYSYASKAIGNILSSQTADRRIKDKALDVKTMIVEGMKKESDS